MTLKAEYDQGDPLAAGRVIAAREFPDDEGELRKVRVIVTRTVRNAPVMVTAPIAQPVGHPFRYRQHVNLIDVWRAAREWLDSLPEDYCLRAECADQRAQEWRRLCQEYLQHVPCLTPETAVAS